MKIGHRRLLPLGVTVAATVFMSACSGDTGDRDRGNTPESWRTCNQLFGASRVDALQDEMGSGELVVRSSLTTVDQVASFLRGIAGRWEPGSGVHYAMTGHPCDLGIDGTSRRFESYVRWSVDTPKGIRDGTATQDGWKSAGNDLYVLSRDGGLSLTVLFPCKIKASHEDQEAELPLEVETRVRNVLDFDPKLLREMTAQLARTLAKGLTCTNNPSLPAAL